MGDKTSRLAVPSTRTIFLHGQPKANVSDHKSMFNIKPFGKCHSLANPTVASATAAHHGHLTPMPCVPNTPMPWMQGKSDVKEKSDQSLKKDCRLRCMWNGTITILTDGQTGTGCSKVQKTGATEQQEQEPIEKSQGKLLDKVQLALDVAGFVPVVGAVADVTNSGIYAFRGDYAAAALSLAAAVPGVGDAAALGKFALKGAKLAKSAKAAKTVTAASKSTAKVANEATIKSLKSCTEMKPLLSVTARKAPAVEAKPLLSVTARKTPAVEAKPLAKVAETPKPSIAAKSEPKLGDLTFNRKPAEPNTKIPAEWENHPTPSGRNLFAGGESIQTSPQTTPHSSITKEVQKAKNELSSPDEIQNEIQKIEKQAKGIMEEMGKNVEKHHLDGTEVDLINKTIDKEIPIPESGLQSAIDKTTNYIKNILKRE